MTNGEELAVLIGEDALFAQEIDAGFRAAEQEPCRQLATGRYECAVKRLGIENCPTCGSIINEAAVPCGRCGWEAGA